LIELAKTEHFPVIAANALPDIKYGKQAWTNSA